MLSNNKLEAYEPMNFWLIYILSLSEYLGETGKLFFLYVELCLHTASLPMIFS